MTNLTGKALGNYQIIEEIGRGGMAVVYRAYQPSLNRYVAIKILPPQMTLDRELVTRFLREAQAAARLAHPNIVHIYDTGVADGLYYIVMEYLSGQTLGHLLEREGALPPTRTARIVEQVASALDYAHERGFVHRDVKPSNIFVGQGDHVTLTDFGIAKAASETQQLTRTGMLMGTPEYMAPEQAEGGIVDHRTDLYALGVVLYQMLTGRAPFRGTTPHATLHAVIYEPPPSPRQINPRLSSALEAVILTAVAKRPEQRYQRGAQMVVALRAALAVQGQQTTVAQPRRQVSPPHRQAGPARARRRSPLVWILAGLAVLVVLLLAGFVLLRNWATDGRKPAPTTAVVFVVATPTPGATTAPPTSGPTASAVPPRSTTAAPTDSPLATTDTPEPAATATQLPTSTAPSPTDTAPPATATPVPPTDTPLPPTDTPKPPTDTPTPACPMEAEGIFAGLWQAYRSQLGCPLTQLPNPVNDSEQAFENGHMFWRADVDQVWVVYEKGSRAGTFQVFPDPWSEGDPEYSCAASPPAGRVQPKLGFGAVWCDLGAAGAPIGWGLGKEQGFGPGYADPLAQDFEGGSIFRDSDGTTRGMAYVFIGDGTFFRVSY